MYETLTEEELITLAISYVVKGVPIPSGVATLLDKQTLADIEDINGHPNRAIKESSGI